MKPYIEIIGIKGSQKTSKSALPGGKAAHGKRAPAAECVRAPDAGGNQGACLVFRAFGVGYHDT